MILLVLWEGFQGAVHSKLGDLEIALLHGEEILSKWRRQVEDGMSERTNENNYACTILPSMCVADKPSIVIHPCICSILKLWMWHECNCLQRKQKKWKEKNTLCIQQSSGFLHPTKQWDNLWTGGENGVCHKWQFMNNGEKDKLEVDEVNLLEDSKYYVMHKYQKQVARREAQKKKQKCQQ
jgi:hypothetical protein